MDREYEVFNPHDKTIDELPFIFGWNNGGSDGWYHAVLMAEDGTHLGGHGSSSECHMYGDLGILKGSRPDRHEGFRKHYPDGYRMDFVHHSDPRLLAAIEKNKMAAPASSEA